MSDTTPANTQTVRWFAGAAAAAGVTEEQLDAATSATLATHSTVREALAIHRPGAAQVLERCSFLADGRSLDGSGAWPVDAAILDVLPPLAGG